MNTELAISTRGLTRYFGPKPVVKQLDFDVPSGSVTALLGLNGAGKSTTIRMLMGMLPPTRGTASVLGKNSTQLGPEDRARIGYTVEGHYVYPWMSVREAERYQRDTFPQWSCEHFAETVRRFSIDPAQKIRQLSRGQRAGVSVALTLATEPELLILDDPALGLDPVSRRGLNETLLDFCESGRRTILISTHMLDDVERIADRVAVMIHGQVVVHTTVDDFRRRVTAWSIDLPPATRIVDTIPGVISLRKLAGRTLVTVADFDEETRAALERVSQDSPQQVDITFEDAVISYLSRTPGSNAFPTATGA